MVVWEGDPGPPGRPLVTYRVQCYQHEAFVDEAVRSVLAQTYTPLDVLITDDASSDRTFEIVEALARAYRGPHRVVLYRSDRNAEVYEHANEALHLMRGAFFVWLSGDDVAEPEQVEALTAAWLEGGLSGVWSNHLVIDAAGRVQGQGLRADHPYTLNLKDYADGRFLDLAYHGACGYTREVLDRFGPLPAHLGARGHEHHFGFRAALLGPKRHLPQPLVRRRSHAGRVTAGENARDRQQDPMIVHERQIRGRLQVFLGCRDAIPGAGRGVPDPWHAHTSEKLLKQMGHDVRRLLEFEEFRRRQQRGAPSHDAVQRAAHAGWRYPPNTISFVRKLPEFESNLVAGECKFWATRGILDRSNPTSFGITSTLASSAHGRRPSCSRGSKAGNLQTFRNTAPAAVVTLLHSEEKRMKKSSRRFRGAIAAGAAVAACLLAFAVPYVLLAQAPSPRTYAWYGELVAVDQKAKSITVKADVEPPVLQYIKDFKAGDKVMVVWSVDRGDAITVLWVPRPEVLKIGTGFIVPADVVAADAASKTLTFRATIPDKVLASVSSIAPGKWIKVAATTDLTGDVAPISAISATDKPQPKPKPVEAPAPAAAPGGRGGGRGRGGPPPDAGGAAAAGGGAATAGLPGKWAVEASLGGNAITTQCTFAVEGPKISGSCSNQLGMSDVTGEIMGAAVKFAFKMEIQGMALAFDHTATLDAGGKTMKGTVSVFGMMAEFTATKQ